jgi:hypothetical protein
MEGQIQDGTRKEKNESEMVEDGGHKARRFVCSSKREKKARTSRRDDDLSKSFLPLAYPQPLNKTTGDPEKMVALAVSGRGADHPR